MAKNLSDEQVESEIQRLKDSEAVRLAWKYNAYRYKRRQYLYALRQQEKLGLKLMQQGMNLDNLADIMEEGGDQGCDSTE